MVKTQKNIIAIILAILSMLTMLVICTPQTTDAYADTHSNGKQTQVITVVTKANWWLPGSESITLKQTKGTTKNVFFSKKTKQEYGTWSIKVKSTDGTHTQTLTMSGASKKIKLKPNKTYKITVSWAEISNLGKNFIKTPTWKVGNTYKVVNCY